MKIIHTIILLSLFFTSCASITKVEPSDQNNSLVVGQLIWNADVKGTQKGYLILEFENLTTDKKMEFRAVSKNGLFYFLGSPNSQYHLTKIHRKVKQTGKDELVRFSSSLNINANNSVVTITPGKVLNLGYITWISDADDRNVSNASLNQDFSSVDVKKLFAEKFADSAWNSYEWIDMEFSAINKK